MDLFSSSPPPSDSPCLSMCAWLRSKSNGRGWPLSLGTGRQAIPPGPSSGKPRKPGPCTHHALPFSVPPWVCHSASRGVTAWDRQCGQGGACGRDSVTGDDGTSAAGLAGRGRGQHFPMGHCQAIPRLLSSEGAKGCSCHRASALGRGLSMPPTR